jgi:hypothetical protein
MPSLLSPFPRCRRIALTPKGIVHGLRQFGVEMAHHLAIRAKIMVKPFEAEPRPIRFRPEGFAQELDKPPALLQCPFAVILLADAGTRLLARRWAKADKIMHRFSFHVGIARPVLHMLGVRMPPGRLCLHQ